MTDAETMTATAATAPVPAPATRGPAGCRAPPAA